jgi:hypothetical protein
MRSGLDLIVFAPSSVRVLSMMKVAMMSLGGGRGEYVGRWRGWQLNVSRGDRTTPASCE